MPIYTYSIPSGPPITHQQLDRCNSSPKPSPTVQSGIEYLQRVAQLMKVYPDILSRRPLQSSANINCDRENPWACLISRLNKSECYGKRWGARELWFEAIELANSAFCFSELMLRYVWVLVAVTLVIIFNCVISKRGHL